MVMADLQILDLPTICGRGPPIGVRHLDCEFLLRNVLAFYVLCMVGLIGRKSPHITALAVPQPRYCVTAAYTFSKLQNLSDFVHE